MADKQGIKPEIKAAIEQAATAAAQAAVEGAAKLAAGTCSTNHFRAMEALLFNYPLLRDRVEDVEAYMEVELRGRSGSITVAPPKGAGYCDEVDVYDEIKKQKAAAYAQTRAWFDELESVVRKFSGRREFNVVRMYYFNQNFDGSARTHAERWTWEGLTDALSQEGVLQNVKTARRWRSQIVADMAVCMFGPAAAITTQTRRERAQETP